MGFHFRRLKSVFIEENIQDNLKAEERFGELKVISSGRNVQSMRKQGISELGIWSIMEECELITR